MRFSLVVVNSVVVPEGFTSEAFAVDGCFSFERRRAFRARDGIVMKVGPTDGVMTSFTSLVSDLTLGVFSVIGDRAFATRRLSDGAAFESDVTF